MNFTNKQKWIVFGIVGLLMLTISYRSHRRDKEVMYELSGKREEIPIKADEIQENTSLFPPEEEMIMVHIKGEVNMPGVYELKEGARVINAIEAAGGFTDEADQQRVNLAARIYDEASITIYAIGEESINVSINDNNNINSPSRNTGKININHASKGELTQLTGIGDALAERIITYREENGFFKTIDEIKNVSGIGDKKFQEIKESITVQ